MNGKFEGHISGLFYCEPCSFEAILPTWEKELWPGRKSAIEPTSAMKWFGGIDMSLMQSSASFWRIVQTADGAILGVLSGHFGGLIDATDIGLSAKTSSYRTRGLWVSPSIRRAGAAGMLMTSAFEQARREKCASVWTFPRKSSMPFYESAGFIRVGEWIGENDPGAGEFGPNCYAVAKL